MSKSLEKLEALEGVAAVDIVNIDAAAIVDEEVREISLVGISTWDKSKELEFFTTFSTMKAENVSVVLNSLTDPGDIHYFIGKLFELPKQTLQLILKTHTVELLKNLGDNMKAVFIQKLLPNQETLQLIFETHAVDLLKNSGKFQPVFIMKFLALPKQTLQLIFETHAVELLKNSGEFQFVFIEELFKLPEQTLQPILETHAVELLKNSGESQSVFIEKLFELPEQTLQPILETHAIDLVHNSGENQFIFFGSLCSNINNEKIILSEATMHSLATIEGNIISHDLLALMKPLITQINQETLDPIVKALLEKTYALSSSCGDEGRTQFTQNLVNKLKEVIDQSPSLRKILEKSALSDGSIFIGNTGDLAKTAVGSFSQTSNNIHTQGIKDNYGIDDIISNLVHESTHKVISGLYNNNALPYANGDEQSFAEIQRAMDRELIDAKALFSNLYIDKYEQLTQSGQVFSENDLRSQELQDTWLQSMVQLYSTEKMVVIEILPWLTEHTALNILTKTSNNSVSAEFAQIVWQYLQDTVIRPINDNAAVIEMEQMPNSLCLVVPIIPEATSDIAKIAKELVKSGEVSVEWLAQGEAGQLAFRSINRDDKSKLINDLFKTVHPDNQLTYIKKLLKLDPQLLQPILEKALIEGVNIKELVPDLQKHEFLHILKPESSFLAQEALESKDECNEVAAIGHSEGRLMKIFLHFLLVICKGQLHEIFNTYNIHYTVKFIKFFVYKRFMEVLSD